MVISRTMGLNMATSFVIALWEGLGNAMMVVPRALWCVVAYLAGLCRDQVRY